jgi:hypothetical protein
VLEFVVTPRGDDGGLRSVVAATAEELRLTHWLSQTFPLFPPVRGGGTT